MVKIRINLQFVLKYMVCTSHSVDDGWMYDDHYVGLSLLVQQTSTLRQVHLVCGKP